MSGKPNADGVKEVLEGFDRLDVLAREIGEHETAIAKLKAAREEQARVYSDLRAALGRMDLTESGNYGHLERLAWFVSEMRRQVKK